MNLLTLTAFRAMLFVRFTKLHGRENPLFRTGEMSPLPLVAFLCPSFSAALCCARLLWRGYFGKPKGLPHLFAVFSPQLSHAAHYAVRSINGGIPHVRTGLPA